MNHLQTQFLAEIWIYYERVLSLSIIRCKWLNNDQTIEYQQKDCVLFCNNNHEVHTNIFPCGTQPNFNPDLWSIIFTISSESCTPLRLGSRIVWIKSNSEWEDSEIQYTMYTFCSSQLRSCLITGTCGRFYSNGADNHVAGFPINTFTYW